MNWKKRVIVIVMIMMIMIIMIITMIMTITMIMIIMILHDCVGKRLRVVPGRRGAGEEAAVFVKGSPT